MKLSLLREGTYVHDVTKVSVVVQRARHLTMAQKEPFRQPVGVRSTSFGSCNSAFAAQAPQQWGCGPSKTAIVKATFQGMLSDRG